MIETLGKGACFSEEAQKILKNSKSEMQKLHHAFIGSEHVLLSILKNKNNVSKKLEEYKINYDKFKIRTKKIRRKRR